MASAAGAIFSAHQFSAHTLSDFFFVFAARLPVLCPPGGCDKDDEKKRRQKYAVDVLFPIVGSNSFDQNKEHEMN
jgi:hypothetical protein